jgi:hypothetical protein
MANTEEKKKLCFDTEPLTMIAYGLFSSVHTINKMEQLTLFSIL